MAFLAFNRLGLMSMEEVPNKVRIRRVFEPIRANQELYDHLYAQFRQCHKRLKPLFHLLNKPVHLTQPAS